MQTEKSWRVGGVRRDALAWKETLMQRIAVFGLGYVGCVTAACLAREGHEIIGVDLNPVKVNAVMKGEAPLVEPGLSELLQAAFKAGKLHATTNPAEAVARSSSAIVCV